MSPGHRRPQRQRARSPAASTAARREVVEACQRLAACDLIGAGEGNVSLRLADNRFLVTPSGKNKARLLADELVVVDSACSRLEGKGRASTEIRMHLAAYAARPDVEACVHAHPITAVALTVAGVPPPDDLLPETVVTLGPIALAPFAVPGTDEVPASLAPFLAGHDAFLLSRHGALTLGRSLAEAVDRMETLERVARIAFAARQLGSCTPLTRAEVGRVLAAVGRPPRVGGSRQPWVR